MQVCVAGKEFLDLAVRLVDVLGVAGQRDPAKRPLAFAEQRANIRRHETRECERVGEPFVVRDLADVVAVVERRNALRVKGEHRRDVRLARRLGRRDQARVLRRIALRGLPLRDAPACRQVAVDEIVRGCLVRDHVRPDAAPDQFRKNLSRVADQTDTDRASRSARLFHQRERIVEVPRLLVEIACPEPHFDARRLAFDREHRRARHRRGERLRAAHAAQARGQDPLVREVTAEMLAAGLRECLVRALHDALTADVDPRPGGHLAVHHQALAIELVEVLPRRPLRHQVRVGDQHARGVGVRLEHAHRLAGLDQQRLVVVQCAQRRDDGIEALPVARGTTDAAVDDQLLGILGDVRIEVVHQHPQRRLGEPALRGAFGAARRADHPVGVARALRGCERFRIVTMHGEPRCGFLRRAPALPPARRRRSSRSSAPCPSRAGTMP